MANRITAFFSKLFGGSSGSDGPLYPVNPETNRIVLPGSVKQEIATLVKAGNMPDATRRVRNLTGADDKTTKAYLSRLTPAAAKKKRRSYRRS